MRVNGSEQGEFNYLVPFSSGALKQKHVKQIGPAWALFLHYEDRVTTGKGTTGYVLGLKEITDEEPRRLGFDVSVIGRHRRRLAKFRYITTERGRNGYKIKVLKSKKWILIQVNQGKTAAGQGKTAVRQGKSVSSGGSLPFNDIALTLQGHLPVEFLAFYTAYPKKKNRPAAIRAWKKQNIKLEEVPAIMACIEANRNTDEWTKEKRQFCPYPASFLNGRFWEDESPGVGNQGGTHATPNSSGRNSRTGRTAGPFKPKAVGRPIPATPNALARQRED